MLAGGADARPGRDRAGPAAGQGRHHRRPPGHRRRPASTSRSSPRSPSRPPARCCWAREIGAALTALEPLGIDFIGLNCATGPAEMSEHLRHLVPARRASPLSCMPNAGLPVLGTRRRALPADARRARRRARHVHPRVRPRPRRRLLRHDARAPAPGRRAGAAAARSATRRPRPEPRRRVALPARAVPPGHVLPVDRRAHQRQRLQGVPRRDARREAGTTASRSPATRPATARTCSTSASTTSAATASPTCARSPAASPPPRRCRSCSTPPSRPSSRPAWRCSAAARSSTRSTTRTATGPTSRFARVMPIVTRARRGVVALTIDEEGQARTAEWKVARRRRGSSSDLTDNWGMRVEDIIVDCLTFPIAHRPGGDPPRRPRDDRGHPRGQAALPRGADHAGPVQHLLRPQPGSPRRAQLRLPARVRQGRPRLGDRARVQDPADGADPRRAAPGRARHGLRPAPAATEATTRCSASSTCSRASTPPPSGQAGPRSSPRCRSASGSSGASSTASASGLEADLDEALADQRPRSRSSTTPCWPA